MKIVSGKFGGRKLISPYDDRVRPTSDKVRGAVFNMLQARDAIADATVLDAFCGTGALGLEALSRGAKFCRFMDLDRMSLDLAFENVENLSCLNQSDFVKCDATKMRQSDEAYSLVFLDPPYHKNLVHEMLCVLKDGSHLCEGAWIVCETERQCDVSSQGYVLAQDRVYGLIKISLLQYLS